MSQAKRLACKLRTAPPHRLCLLSAFPYCNVFGQAFLHALQPPELMAGWEVWLAAKGRRLLGEGGWCPRNSLCWSPTLSLGSRSFSDPTWYNPEDSTQELPGWLIQAHTGTGSSLPGYKLPYGRQHCIQHDLFRLHTRSSCTQSVPVLDSQDWLHLPRVSSPYRLVTKFLMSGLKQSCSLQQKTAKYYILNFQMWLVYFGQILGNTCS